MALNLAECLALTAEQYPARIAAVLEEVRLSYRDLADAARRVANGLTGMGLVPGDRVAVMLPNTPHFPMVYYGVLWAGLTVIPMNPTLRRREIVFQLRDSGAKALFVWQEMAEEAVAAFVEVDGCAHLVQVEAGREASQPKEGVSFCRLVSAASQRFDMVQTQPTDTAVIMYTAAELGTPRGAMLSHFSLFMNALVVKEYVLHYTPEDVFLAALPLFHSFGQSTMMNAPFLAGARVVFLPRFDAGKLLEAVARERVTLLALVPTMYHYLVGYRRDQSFDLSSLRTAVTGGAAMPEALALAFERRFGTPVLEGYGLTETSPVVSFNPSVLENRPGSIGRPIWGCRVAAVREDGAFAKAGEIGEIVIRGHNVMNGYLNQPEVTRQALRGGWFHTGDLGYLDQDGYIFLTGLKKEMILRAGMNVYPREVELVLREHPAVRHAAVLGVPDEVRGQEVQAFVELFDGASVSEKELLAFCRERLAAYKCPRNIKLWEEGDLRPEGCGAGGTTHKEFG